MNRRWLVLGVLFVARVAMGFQYQTIGSTAPWLTQALHVGFTEIGTLIGLYHISGVFLSLPGGLIIHRMGDKTVCALGLIAMAAGGLIVALADSYGAAFAGRLISGMGGILFNLVLSKMTADWFARREIVLAMALILSTWPLGIALGLFTQPHLAEAFGWRTVMLLSAGLCLASLILVTTLYRAPPEEPSDSTRSTRALGLPPATVLLPVVVAGVMWGAFNAGLVGYFSFVPLLLAERGMTIAQAGGLTSLALWVGMLSIPLGGLMAQRLGRPGTTIVLFSGAASVALASVALGAPPSLACLTFGLAIGPPPGVITSLPARVLTPADRAAGFGMFYTCHFLLQASGPTVAGWIHDHAGGAAAVWFAAALFVVPLPMLAVFEILARRSRSTKPLAR